MIEALRDEVWLEALPDGWLTRAEAITLAELAKGRRVLEVGSWLGRSTVAMARTATQVVAVDHHHGPPYDGEGSTLNRFLANLQRLEITNVVPVLAPSEMALPILDGGFEMAFIDGNHDAPYVIHDGRAAYRLLRIGAPIVFHDYDAHVGVNSGVHELAKRWECNFERRAESLAIMYRR